MTLDQVKKYLYDNYNIDIPLYSLRLRLKNYELTGYQKDNYHVDYKEEEIKELGDFLISDLVFMNVINSNQDLNYNKLYYACLKLGIELGRKFTKLYFLSKEDKKDAIEFCRKKV